MIHSTDPLDVRAAHDAIAEQKANFLAVISHELRTPMQSIYGLLELIEQDNTNTEMSDLIHAAQGSATLMLDLLDEILDFARLDANRLELEQLEIPIRTLIQGVVEALRVRIGNKPVVLDYQIDPDLPMIILGDPKRLRQMLFNLVGNALKFTPQGSIQLQISYLPSSFPDQNSIRFEIHDTGIGIAPDIQKRLFQPFTQGDNTVARKYGGAGLGLSICQKLVDLMGGSIGVESKPGHGSLFWFEVPCASGVYDHFDTSLDLSGLHILALESHPNAAREIERSLRQMNADVHVVSTVQEARLRLKQHRFDVTMTDYTLPDGGGIDFIRDALIEFPRMGLIMYTFYEHDGLIQNLRALGVTYLSKPASRKGLGQTVLDVAKRYWLEQDDIPQRVLLAEDTESVRDILKRQIERMGVTVDLATNGKEALVLLDQHSYGLVITDLHMPDMDGFILTQEIRTREQDKIRTPIILLTADIQLSERHIYLRHGFDDCLTKPVTFHHLRHALQRWGLNLRTVTSAPPALIEMENNPVLIDLPGLMAQIEGSRAEAVMILKSFPVMTLPIIHRLKGSLLHDITEAAHSLKGAAQFACCSQLADLCHQVQKNGEAGHLDPHLIQMIENIFQDVCQEIEQL